MNTNVASSLSEKAYAESNGNPALANQYVIDNSGGNDKVAKQALSFLNSKIRAADKQKTKSIEDTTSKIYQRADAGQDYTDLINSLPPGEERNKVIDGLNKNGGRGAIVSNPAMRDVLNERFAWDPEFAKKTDLNAFRNDFSKEDMDMFQAKRERYIKAETDEVVRAQLGMDSEKDRIVSVYIGSKSIFDPEVKNQVRAIADRRYEQLLKENPKATRREINQALNAELLARGTKKEVSWSTFGPFKWGKEETILPNPDLVKPDGYVDDYWLQQIKKTDPNFSDSQINQAIQNLKNAGIDVSIPKQKK
jgi:hypothetical protein